MEFAFSEEQEMLRTQARQFLEARVASDRVVELAQSELGWDPESWRQIVDLGWVGLSTPERAGGSGMTFLDEAVLFEELGRALYPGPFFATVALALPAFAANAPDLVRAIVAGAPATLAWAEPEGPYVFDDLSEISTKAEESGATWSLSGDKHLVVDLAAAQHVAVVAKAPDGIGIWAVDPRAAVTRPLSTMDTTRRYGSLSLAGTQATLLVEPSMADAVVAGIRRRAYVALSLEAVGIAQRAWELSIAHASERKQFDKPIGTYQAVSHPIANTYVEAELARSLTYWAAWCVSDSDPQADIAAAAAKAMAGEAAVAACERAIQVHGGIGFTWEHVLHRYYKRAQWIESFDGSGAPRRAEVARHLLTR